MKISKTHHITKQGIMKRNPLPNPTVADHSLSEQQRRRMIDAFTGMIDEFENNFDNISEQDLLDFCEMYRQDIIEILKQKRAKLRGREDWWNV